MKDQIIDFVRSTYKTSKFIPLHAPVFDKLEEDYVIETVRSTFVSSVGAFVDRFEAQVAAFTGAQHAVATVNGTSALQVALRLSGVRDGDLVITQPLTFIATCNAISYLNATPVFIDVDRDTMGLSPTALAQWLEENAVVDGDGICRFKGGNILRACVVMHTFGHPAKMIELVDVCQKWNIRLIEDAAESLGSTYRGQHTGTIADIGTLSFNGNKIITTGGGGMILAKGLDGSRAKHLTTTAKVPHAFEYVHDEVGYNFRLPNINAALGCAQMEKIETFLSKKRDLAKGYRELLQGSDLAFQEEPNGCKSNFWLNAVICPDLRYRNELLSATNEAGVMTRPIWRLMSELTMFKTCPSGDLTNSRWLEARVVNLPSSVPLS